MVPHTGDDSVLTLLCSQSHYGPRRVGNALSAASHMASLAAGELRQNNAPPLSFAHRKRYSADSCTFPMQHRICSVSSGLAVIEGATLWHTNCCLVWFSCWRWAPGHTSSAWSSLSPLQSCGRQTFSCAPWAGNLQRTAASIRWFKRVLLQKQKKKEM